MYYRRPYISPSPGRPTKTRPMSCCATTAGSRAGLSPGWTSCRHTGGRDFPDVRGQAHATVAPLEVRS